MPSRVTVAARTGVDWYGKPTYGTATSYQCRLVYKRTLMRGPGGEDIDSSHQVHLMTADAIVATARLTLATADVGSTDEAAIHPTIMSVGRRYDQTGAHHVVLYL
jgi:hypothetical protein